MKTSTRVTFLLLIFINFLSVSQARAEQIGSVDTKFNLLTPDHSINIEAFDDPEINGVTCYLSRAKKGGIKGALGIAEETSDASLDCKQVGPISFKEDAKEGERVFKERRSFLFKKLQVIRFFDEKRKVIIYLAYSDKVIEGSPQNSISAVPVMPWPQGEVPAIPTE